MTKNFHELVSNNTPQIQGAQRTASKLNASHQNKTKNYHFETTENQK